MTGEIKVPTAEQVRAARKAAGLTQEAAADLIGTSRRSWQEWESGRTPMRAGLWELFRIKAEVIV
jgi:transcriptional regulator with XRE-family HTH domain